MTPDDFRAARLRLGLSVNQLAHIMGIDARSLRKWEMTAGSNMRPPNPVAIRILEWLEEGFRPPQWPTSSIDGEK